MRSFWRCISSGEEKTGLTTKTAKATWNGAVIAETDTYEVVEGNVYFPPSSCELALASANKEKESPLFLMEISVSRVAKQFVCFKIKTKRSERA